MKLRLLTVICLTSYRLASTSHADVTLPAVFSDHMVLQPEQPAPIFRGDRAVAVIVADVPSRYSFERDPKDEAYLNLAIAALAHYLITWDKDLLDMMNADSTAGQSLHRIHPDLVVLTPPEFLRVIRSI